MRGPTSSAASSPCTSNQIQASARSRRPGRPSVRSAAIVAATSADAPPGARYPATTHADVRYLVNYVSVALTHDLRAFVPERAEVVWEFWRAAYDAIALLLHLGVEDDLLRVAGELGRRQLE